MERSEQDCLALSNEQTARQQPVAAPGGFEQANGSLEQAQGCEDRVALSRAETQQVLLSRK